jgi:cytochrome c556
MKITKITVTLLTIAGLSAAAFAANLEPAEQIETRQAGYKFMSWNMKKIKANLEGNYSQAAVQGAANAIAGIANSGMGALYGPGTDKAIGDVQTRVKPELFTEPEEVGRVARDFIEAANDLVEVAALGDPDDVKTAFGDLGKSCKACHDQFRMDKK